MTMRVGARRVLLFGSGRVRDYLMSAPTIMEEFGNTAEWSTAGAPTLALDATHVISGTSSIRITNAGDASMTKAVNWDVSQTDLFTIWVYSASGANILRLYLASTSTFTKNAMAGATLAAGWNKFVFHRDDFTLSGGMAWTEPIVRVRVYIALNAQAGVDVSVDALGFGEYRRPKVLITFDDGHESVLSQAYAYMQPRGVLGTVYAAHDIAGTAGYMTEANLTTLYTGGWDVANHSYDHANLTTFDAATQQNKLTSNAAWLESLGFTRRPMARHVAYPGGFNNADTLTAMAGAGMLTGRTTVGGYNDHETFSLAPYLLYGTGIGNHRTLATVQGYVDGAIKYGKQIELYFHKLVETATDTTEWAIADFQALIDYILTKQAQIDAVTVSQWYLGLNR